MPDRLSNLLAAVGRGQLRRLDEMLARRREIYEGYAAALADLPGVTMAPIEPRGTTNHWLTIIELGDECPARPADLIDGLAEVDIEARPTWKPMHLQPVWQHCPMVGGSVSEEVFARGVCLPSGSGMSDEQQQRVTETARKVLEGG